MILSEAELQVLIVLIELEDPVETPNNNFYQFYPKSVEAAATYFRDCRLDWAEAFVKLKDQGLVSQDGSGYSLSANGKQQARQVRQDRPPIYYWYREFFPAAAHSRAYAEFCERLYGKNLCQAGFSDMPQIDDMIESVKLTPHSRVLDLGCGNGMLAEYVSDRTGARLWGMDYCPEAVEMAMARTQSRRERLSYQIGNLDHMEYQEHFFDAILSIDSLYMPNHLDKTLQQITGLLKPGGQLAAFYTQMVWGDDAARDSLLPEKTLLGVSLQKAALSFTARDYTSQTYCLMQLKRHIGEEMQPAFAAEGNLMLYDFIINESEASLAPYDAETCYFGRYLYHVRLA
jgi:ubiquinone/menaquinone biosynthesis C-methylase UbiE